jgi:NAD(P)-dependent dehydrogenase (short-subunit alcohol dehydrogenase family)
MSATPNTPDDTRPVVFITGCSSGIGRALAVEFAGAGKHRVVATARKMSALETLPPNVWRFALDVTDAESVREAVDEAVRQLGRIDLLINNAGTNAAVGPVVEVDIERQRQTFEANVSVLKALRRDAAKIWRVGLAMDATRSQHQPLGNACACSWAAGARADSHPVGSTSAFCA